MIPQKFVFPDARVCSHFHWDRSLAPAVLRSGKPERMLPLAVAWTCVGHTR